MISALLFGKISRASFCHKRHRGNGADRLSGIQQDHPSKYCLTGFGVPMSSSILVVSRICPAKATSEIRD